MIDMYLWCLAFGVFAAVCGFALGPKWGARLVLVVAIVGGAVLSFVAPDYGGHFLMLVPIAATAIVVSGGLGLVAGVFLSARQYWLAILLFLPYPYLIWSTKATVSQKVAENALALEFVMSNKQVLELAGGPYKAFLGSFTTNNGESIPRRYEFGIAGPNSFELIVDVSRQSGAPKFSIACATKLTLGQREPFKDACLQSPLPFPK